MLGMIANASGGGATSSSIMAATTNQRRTTNDIETENVRFVNTPFCENDDKKSGGGECDICASSEMTESPVPSNERFFGTIVELPSLIQCPWCKLCSPCRDCIFSHFETRDETEGGIPTCLSCNKKYPIVTFEAVIARGQYRKKFMELSRLKTSAAGIRREISLLSVSMPVAKARRSRSLFLHSLSREYFRTLQMAHDISIKWTRTTCNPSKVDGDRNSSLFSVIAIPHENRIFRTFGGFLRCGGATQQREGVTRSAALEAFVSLFTLSMSVNGDPSVETDDASCKGAVSAIATLASLIFSFFANERTRPHSTTDYRGVEKFRERVSELFGEKKNLCWNEARDRYIRRAGDILALKRFITFLPKEWWMSPNANAVAGVIFHFAENGTYRGSAFSEASVKSAKRGNQFSETSSGNMFIPCLKNSCRGFMYKTKIAMSPSGDGSGEEYSNNSAAECRLCNEMACLECREKVPRQIFESRSHICDEQVLASVKELERTTRPCPRCAAPIEHDGGCPDMFCTACNLPYDWETLRPRTENTNPDFHTWVRRLRNRVRENTEFLTSSTETATAQIVREIREAFGSTVRGEDGRTPRERIEELSHMLEIEGLRTVSHFIIHSALSIEIYSFNSFIKVIPTPANFENARLAHLAGDLSEEEWMRSVSDKETLTTTSMRAISALEKFSNEVIETANEAHNSWTSSPHYGSAEPLKSYARSVIESVALTKAVKSAAEATRTIASSILICPASQSRANGVPYYIFPNSLKFEKTLRPERRDTSVISSIGTQMYPSLMNGGHLFWSSCRNEIRRIKRIFEMNRPSTIVEEMAMACRVTDSKVLKDRERMERETSALLGGIMRPLPNNENDNNLIAAAALEAEHVASDGGGEASSDMEDNLQAEAEGAAAATAVLALGATLRNLFNTI